MEVEGAKEVGGGTSLAFKNVQHDGLAGLDMPSGRKRFLAGLGKVKSYLDSGVFEAVQVAGITALGLDDSVTDRISGRFIRNGVTR